MIEHPRPIQETSFFLFSESTPDDLVFVKNLAFGQERGQRVQRGRESGIWNGGGQDAQSAQENV